MLKKRLIATLLMRDGLIVQSIGFNRYLPIGRPRLPIEFVVKWDVDEIVLLDMSASPQGRGPDSEVLEMLSKFCFVPLTIGGGIRTVDDVRNAIRSGADKVSINTHALLRPELITEIADVFGSQCVVVSMDCHLEPNGEYQVYAESGSQATGLKPVQWAQRCAELGAGEIFLNSIDRDGMRSGYDIELIKSITSSVNIPVIACGGVGSFKHFAPGIIEAGASAVAAANIFHHTEHSTIFAKAHMHKSGIDVRLDSQAKYDSREFDEDGRLVMLSADVLSEVEFQRYEAGRLK
jgi:imidazole glycerol-phosphate synthase subunit HisF